MTHPILAMVCAMMVSPNAEKIFHQGIYKLGSK
jgi:hypothetical protein